MKKWCCGHDDLDKTLGQEQNTAIEIFFTNTLIQKQQFQRENNKNDTFSVQMIRSKGTLTWPHLVLSPYLISAPSALVCWLVKPQVCNSNLDLVSFLQLALGNSSIFQFEHMCLSFAICGGEIWGRRAVREIWLRESETES